MDRKKLSNIQWQFVRFSILICLVMTVFVIVLIFIDHPKDILLFIKKQTWGIPVVLSLLLAAIMIGAIFGYVNGNHLKKRFEILIQSTLAFERGNFSHRAPHLGYDEIGQMGKHLNDMASRVEAQVASLQRLSSEKAEWNETLKQTAIAEERQRLARELHDAVSQQLFAISMMTSAVSKTIEEQPEKASSQIEMIEKMAGEAQSEMRALLLHLRPTHLEGKRLKEGVENLLNELKSKHELSIKWQVEEITGLAKGIEDHLFRIIQEAISNTLRHAKAYSIALHLYVINDQVRLKITDDGVGFDADEKKTSSYGLRSMVERVNEIGGVIEIFSRPQKGTQIEVKIPLVKMNQ
ncbi:sensor histidine kinase [Pueribacillus theae]|uniref:Sensor histidine kinase n=1 Tax=Pueribacillus theae TaxID=2171751 RepID=A0A2U1K3R7_9BACI|nr:sensor histidine kinase [Pueribacillus theae]PWA12177.1 sensor histidine kinase [Pueribacillus theae]